MSSPLFKLGFRFQHQLQFNSRYFCNSTHFDITAISDPDIFMAHVREQCRLGFHNLQFPIKLFHRMMSLARRPSSIEFSRLFATMLKLKHLQPHSTVISLSRLLDVSGTRPDLYSLSILANCYCHLGRVDFGYSLLAKSLKLGYPSESNLILFNTLVNGHVHNNQLPQAVNLLDVAVVKLGIQPSIVTYGTMVKGLCGIGDNDSALHLLRQMKSHPSGCKPDLVIYTTVIDSLCKHKSVTEALNLFSVMKTEGIKPNVYTYTSLIRGMLNLGRKVEAKEMLVEMMESNIEPNVATYSMLINVHSKEGMFDEAKAILQMMIKRGLTPNVVTYTALLDGYCLCGQMDKARDLMDLMVKSHCQPNVVTYATLINGYVKLGSIDKALDIFKEMCEHGIAPDVVVYNILIDGLCKAGRVQHAENLVSDLLSRGLAPSLRTYNILSKATGK